MGSFTVLDIGASSTRYASENGQIEILPNNMVIVDQGARVDLETHSDKITDALDLTITKEGVSDYFPVRVLIGDLAMRYAVSNLKPSVMQHKYKQQINYISVIAATAVNKLKYDLGADMNLYIALPPIEIRDTDAKDVMSSQLTGTYEVAFNKYNNKVVKLNIMEVKCFEESFMCLMAYFFNMQGSVRDEAKPYCRGTVLSMDIGASTTDLAAAKDRHYIERSGATYKTGINIARDYLMKEVRAKHGYDISDDEADRVMCEGRIEIGNKYVDVTGMVEAAKKHLAEQIVSQMQNYFRSVDIQLQSIRAVIVSGGGSMQSSYVDDNGTKCVTARSISEYITDELHKICDTIDVIAFASIENPRLANVMGLFIRANVDIYNAKKKTGAVESKQATGNTANTPKASASKPVTDNKTAGSKDNKED